MPARAHCAALFGAKVGLMRMGRVVGVGILTNV